MRLRPPKSPGWTGKIYSTRNELDGDMARREWDSWHDEARTNAMICSALASIVTVVVSIVSMIVILKG